MKKIYLCTLVFLLSLFSANADYSPSPDFQERLHEAAVNINTLLENKSSVHKTRFLEIIQEYKIQYAGDERAQYILDYIYEFLVEDKSQQSDRPNILLIIADDMGLDASPGYNEGGTKASMPHLEDMISNGLVFENFWTAPTCTPTRGTILTGKYGVRTGVLAVDDPMPLTEKPLQSFLPQSYSHAVIGKWHLSKDPDHPNDIGIDYYAGMLSGGVKSYWDWTLTENGQQTEKTSYITSSFTDLAIDWTKKQDNPWFLWLAYTSPHTPFHLPPTDLHSADDLDPSETAIEVNPLPYYHAMLESLDTEIGRLLDSFSEEELKNTLIIFMGDNGTPGQVVQSPYEKRKAKGSLYQGGINTPLIVSGAGVSRIGERESALVNSVDLFATILDLSSADSYETQDSLSFAELLTDASAQKRTYAYGEVGGTSPQAGFTLRDSQYKYLKLDSGRTFFYDLKNDPYETNNLYRNPSSSQEESLSRLESIALEIRGE